MDTTFNTTLENIEKLPLPEQKMIVNIINRRINEYKRNQVIREVREGKAEYKKGKTKRGTAEDLLKEIEDE